MKAKALLGSPLAETLPTLTPRCLLGLKTAAIDRRPGLRPSIRAGCWNPIALGLPSKEMLNMVVGGGGFYSSNEGESSSA